MSMIAIPINDDVSSLLREIDVPGERELTSHLTLFYLGDNLSFEKLNEYMPLIHNITSKQKPFILSFKNYTCFEKNKNGYPVICKVKSPEVIEFRKKLKEQFDDNKVEYSNKFPTFKPHITLSYSKKELDNEKFPEIAFQVNKVSLYGGDEGKSKVYVEFEFGGGKKLSSGYVEEMSSYFCKMANK